MYRQLPNKKLKRPVVYLAGAIESCKTPAETHGWRKDAEQILADLGFEVLCPICHGEGDLYGVNLTEQQCIDIVHTDFALVKRSDYLLVNAEVRSEGTAMEVLRASEHGITIVAYGLQKQQRCFLRAHADIVIEEPNLLKAIEALYDNEATFQRGTVPA